MAPPASAVNDFSFGSFHVSRDRRCVTRGDAPLRLGSRAFDLLVALLDRAGDVVSHRDLVASVWPSTVVEETSLRVHMSALRRAIGDGQGGSRFIENVPGRGYCFVAPVVYAGPAGAARRELPQPRSNPMIGRSRAVAALRELLRNHRAVTIAGPGGIGKTTLARALAAECGDSHLAGAVFVDLTSIVEGSQLAGALAGALDLSGDVDHSFGSLAESLHGTDILIVLDNCEHVIAATADLVERLLLGTTVSILATSREPIGVAGEWTYRLDPLDLPPRDRPLQAGEAMQFPAIELFVARASAAIGNTFAVTAENVADICSLAWHLDGSPLAVELVAAHVPTLGLRELRSRIGEHVALNLPGRRTAVPRHQTLAAMLEWSYELLTGDERTVLRRLGVFRGSFRLDAACRVASDAAIDFDRVLVAVLSLTTKSLICADTGNDVAEYRLLDTTRTFALQKLRGAEPIDLVFRRHALEMLKMMTVASAEYSGLSRVPWLEAHGGQVGNVHAALDWCFSETGDLQTGIHLMLNALPLHEPGLLAEHTARVGRALVYLRGLEPPRPDLELRLHVKLTWPSLEPDWRGQPTSALLSRAMELAEGIGDPTVRIVTHYCHWLSAFVAGDYPVAAKMAEAVLAIAEAARDEAGEVLALRLLAQCRHYMGQHAEARRLAELTLAREAYRLPPEYASTIPHGVSMRMMLARMMWLQGQPDSALRMAEECMALAEHAHSHAQLQTLSFALIPITIWRGDLDRAEALVERLLVVARQAHSPYWASWAASFSAVLEAMRDGDRVPRLPAVQVRNAKELDGMASVAGRWDHPASLSRLDADTDHWCAAEVLRKHGEAVLLRDGPAGRGAAERAFVRALDIARRQGALAWQLRAASSLARLWAGDGRSAEARALVAPLLAAFHEGHDTADLRAAAELLSACDRQRARCGAAPA
jgi:predicted ATPase/DNA-binding winged helix-turn-helix (wHTH) protein